MLQEIMIWIHWLLDTMTTWLVSTVQGWGYWGVMILMTIESSFIPFPSEVVLIPAGYLAHQGKMSIPIILLCSLIGSLAGAFINYYLALFVGRSFLERYGKYMFISPEILKKSDVFFEKYGAIATLTGRLLPGIRQLISLPAGLCRMNLPVFTLYTTIGAGSWSLFLILLGYFIGDNQALINDNLSKAPYIIVALVVLVVIVYFFKKRKLISAKI